MCIDPTGLTITLVGTAEEMEATFEQLQALTNDQLDYDDKTGVVFILNPGTMNTDKTLDAGTKMVSGLIGNNNYNVQIERINEENKGCFVWYGNNGATIQMNNWAESGNSWFYEVSDGNGGTKLEDHKDVAHIILGHELIHATHHMNGTIANPSIKVYRYTKKRTRIG